MAEDVANLVVQVALENSNFQKNIQAMNRQIRAATAEFKNSTSGLDKYGKGLDGLESKSKMLSKQVDAQSKILTEYRTKLEESRRRLDENAKAQVDLKDRLNSVTKEYNKSIESTGKNSDESKNLKEELEKLTKEYENNEEKIRNNVATMENWEIKTDNAERKYKDLEQSLQDTNKEIDIQSSKWTQLSDKLQKVGETAGKIGDKMQSVGKDLTKKLTAPVMGIGIAAAKIGMDFEQSMSKVKAMSGASEEEMVQLEKAARDAGATTSKSAKDAADALSYMALAGWDSKTSIDALMPVLRLSEAGEIGLAKASSLVTDSMSAMGIQIQDLPKYLDIVAQTARSSNTDIDQMAEAFLGVGGILRGLNVPLEESALALGFLANAGTKGSEAGTALSAILVNLTAPTGQAKKALEELKFTAFDSQGNFKGLENVLFELQGKMKGMTEKQKNMYLSMIGGKERLKDLNALLNGLDDSYETLTKDIADFDGALEDTAKTMQKNNKGSITELKSAIEELGLKIYNVLRPAIANLIDMIQGWVDKLNNLTPAQQEAIIKMAGIAAAIGPLLLIIGKLTSNIGTSILKFALLSEKIGQVGGVAKLFGLGLKALPIAGVVAGVALLSAGVVKLIKHFRSASIGTKEFGDEVSEGTRQAIEGFVDLNEETTRELTELSIKQETLTKEMATSLDNKFRDMSNIIKDNIVESKNEAVKNLTELFAKTESLSEEEKQAIIKSTEEAYEAKRKAIEDADLRVSEILMNAAEGNRELRQEELAEIKEHQQFITENGIKALTDNEVEQRAILERMKENASVISAEQAAEVVKNSVEQKDKVIADAEEQYKKTIAEIIRLRDESGAITEEQAEKMKKAAKEQKQSIIDDAKEMHNKVVEEAQKQAEEHVEYVDWETGEIYSKWDILGQNIRKWWENKKEETKRDAKETSKMIKDGLKEQMETLGKIPGEVAKKGREIYNSLVGELEKIIDKAKEIGRNVMEGLKEGIQNKLSVPVNAIKDAAGKVVSKAREVFDTHSPSREFESIGADNMMGLALGIEENTDLAVKAAEKASQLVKEAGFNEAIKRLNIDTGKDNENLLNTIAIVEVQKQKIESLSKEYEKLTNTKAKNKKEAEKLNKERERAKKELESAKTELMKYEREVEKATEKIIENHKKAREEMLKEEEKIRDEQIKAVDDLHKSITSALKKRYEEEGKIREDALSKEIKDLDEWKNESLKRINSVYDEKIKKIDESSNRHIKALEEELKALDKSEQERSREEVEDEYKSDINKLEDALKYEHDEYNREQIQKEIDRRKKEHEKQLNDWSVEDKKAALNRQIEDIRNSAEIEKEILENKRLEELDRIDTLYDFERDVLESKMEDNRDFLQQMTDDRHLQIEAEKMMVKNQQDDIVYLLHQYEPDYFHAGESLGQQMFEGFLPQIMKMIDLANAIRAEFGIEPISETTLRRRFKHAYKQDLSVYTPQDKYITYRPSEELYGSYALPEKKVEYNVSITSPKALNAAEQRRAMNRELKKLSFEVV